MTPGSFWRRLPAAALRAFVNSRSSAAAWRLFNASNAASGMNTSPADFEQGRNALALELLRDLLDRAQVLGDVLAGDTVATRRADDEATVLVLQRDGETVELGFGDEADRTGNEPLDARSPREQLLVRERVVERQHRHPVLDGREGRRGRPPGRCVGESGVISAGCFALELAELADQRVELGVGDLRLVEHEVVLVVGVDLLAQLPHSSDGGSGWLRREASSSEISVGIERRGRGVMHAVAELAGKAHRAFGLATRP